jgi:hypothetical protein
MKGFSVSGIDVCSFARVWKCSVRPSHIFEVRIAVLSEKCKLANPTGSNYEI